MAEERLLTVQFCDDIRQEVGNKFSLMGCYGDDMFFQSLPATLPKFCAYVKAITPRQRPFSRLTFRGILNGESLGEVNISDEALSKMKEFAARSEGERVAGAASMTIAPFLVAEPSVLYIEAETESETLRTPPFRLTVLS